MATYDNGVTVLKTKKKETSKLIDGMFNNASIPVLKTVKQSWSDIDNIYLALANAIVDVAENYQAAVSLIVNSNISNTNEIVLSIKSLSNDLENFTTDLLSIKKRHEGRTGTVEDGDDLANCLSVFSDYSVLNDRFKAVIFPAMITITEASAEAVDNAQKLVNAEAEAASTTPKAEEPIIETKDAVQ